jgi:hypothetical protein
MHPLPAELPHEATGVFKPAEPKHLIPFLFPDDGSAEPRKRESVHPAEVADFLMVRARAFLIRERDPLRKTAFLRALHACLPMSDVAAFSPRRGLDFRRTK